MILVANFIRFLAVKNFENPLRFDKVAESFKVGTFLRHSVQFNQEGLERGCGPYKLINE